MPPLPLELSRVLIQEKKESATKWRKSPEKGLQKSGESQKKGQHIKSVQKHFRHFRLNRWDKYYFIRHRRRRRWSRPSCKRLDMARESVPTIRCHRLPPLSKTGVRGQPPRHITDADATAGAAQSCKSKSSGRKASCENIKHDYISEAAVAE